MIDASIERMLIRASQHSHSPEFKMAAAIEINNEVISVGYNKFKTHPHFGVGIFGHIHAELDAIRLALKITDDLSKATLYVYRRNRNLAKPCIHCQRKIKEYNIKQVFYSHKEWVKMVA